MSICCNCPLNFLLFLYFSSQRMDYHQTISYCLRLKKKCPHLSLIYSQPQPIHSLPPSRVSLFTYPVKSSYKGYTTGLLLISCYGSQQPRQLWRGQPPGAYSIVISICFNQLWLRKRNLNCVDQH